MKVDADKIKAAVAWYWRYDRQCPLIAFECSPNGFGGEVSDVLAITEGRHLVEIEVKLNIADFRKDRNKGKHRFFKRGSQGILVAYFYFAVPKEIANKVGLLCDNLYPYAGVLGVKGYQGFQGDVEVYRRARLISNQQLSLLQVARIAKGQSATLCHLAIKLASNNEQEIR